ncbi:hypothetical protein GWE18_15130 [Bradyrhizobium sp. CSA112]|uniref:hypothetical protein n=1 Tax=Bradyrhizobium sp. CSA112 TaxID=2699170 RepID=UPI0023B1B46A|nr:hypothetical protein [Bradyrhizobium sp. CSA112]MDE5454160.1 hypothetical protein [Bradyrhizobium sp. CSA112]
MKTAALLGLVLSITISSVAGAEKLTLACRFEGSERPGPEREKNVNQLHVDTDLPVVELRVAQTMGTSNEVYFGYRNRPAKGMTDDKILLYFLGSKMSMAAIRLGVPTSIVLDRLSGSMVWSWADETGSRAYRYRCEP